MTAEAKTVSPFLPPPRARVISLALIRRPSDGGWLAVYAEDALNGNAFYRPAGGGVEFGAEVEPIRLWGVTENIFTYMGTPVC